MAGWPHHGPERYWQRQREYYYYQSPARRHGRRRSSSSTRWQGQGEPVRGWGWVGGSSDGGHRASDITRHFNASPIVNKLLCGHPLAEELPKPIHVTVTRSSPTPHLFEMMTRLNMQPVHVYGLTETYGPITKGYYTSLGHIPPKEKYQRMVRQGHGSVTSLPIRVIKAGSPDGKIVNVKQDGKEMGEVVFEGNICAKGYYRNPEATKELFAGGVLHSEDEAVWHEDGSFQVLGRQEDIIIIGNYLIAFYSPYYSKYRSQPADTDSNTNRRDKVLFPHP